MRSYMKIIYVVVLIFALVSTIEAKRRRKTRKSMILRQKETNAVEFIRLAIMRLIYGIATRVGLGEQISEALGGVFVPPGVDEYSDYGDGGFGLLDREDDYDY